MGELVNLRKFRKQAKKRDDAERAAANRVVHGRSKAERELDDKSTSRLHRHLDGHRIDSGDA
jgi:ribosomal protein S2